MTLRPIYNAKGWVLCRCTECGHLNYVEPHGTTAQCRCRHGEETEHEPIPESERVQTLTGEVYRG